MRALGWSRGMAGVRGWRRWALCSKGAEGSRAGGWGHVPPSAWPRPGAWCGREPTGKAALLPAAFQDPPYLPLSTCAPDRSTSCSISFWFQKYSSPRVAAQKAYLVSSQTFSLHRDKSSYCGSAARARQLWEQIRSGFPSPSRSAARLAGFASEMELAAPQFLAALLLTPSLELKRPSTCPRSTRSFASFDFVILTAFL